MKKTEEDRMGSWLVNWVEMGGGREEDGGREWMRGEEEKMERMLI